MQGMESLLAGASGVASGATIKARAKMQNSVGAAAGKLTSHALKQKEESKAILLDLSAPLRRNMMHKLRHVIFGTWCDDPSMGPAVKDYIAGMIDLIWADIEMEIETSLADAVLNTRTVSPDRGLGQGRHWLARWLFRARSWLLYHYLPSDKSIFGKFKDPAYILIFILTCLPIHGLRTGIFVLLLLCLVFPGPPDEYQLLNFVLTFKGLQFVSGGIACCSMWAITAFVCYSSSREEMLKCLDTEGPGGYPIWGEAVDYLGAIFLPNLAFFLLPISKKYAKVEYVGRLAMMQEVEAAARSDEVLLSGASADGIQEKTLYDSVWLRRLFFYDLKCFTGTMVFLFVFTLITCDFSLAASPQLATNIFICRVLYSFSSLPWLFFCVPAFLSLLTHCYPTGFTPDGRCVVFLMPSEYWGTPEAPAAAEPEAERGGSCRERPPAVGDRVIFAKGEAISAADAAGNPGAFTLRAWEPATVVEVDAEGDFRLSNDAGKESSWHYREYYEYHTAAHERPSDELPPYDQWSPTDYAGHLTAFDRF